MGEKLARYLGALMVIAGLHSVVIGEPVGGWTLAAFGALTLFHSWGVVKLSGRDIDGKSWHEYALPVVAHVRVKAATECEAEAILKAAMEGDTLPKGIEVQSVDMTPDPA